jgi:hypothetical protein
VLPRVGRIVASGDTSAGAVVPSPPGSDADSLGDGDCESFGPSEVVVEEELFSGVDVTSSVAPKGIVNVSVVAPDPPSGLVTATSRGCFLWHGCNPCSGNATGHSRRNLGAPARVELLYKGPIRIRQINVWKFDGRSRIIYYFV